MIKNWLKGVAIAALMAAGAVAAQAADLPTRKEAPAPVFVPPPFTWTGFYIGLNAGGIISSGSRNATLTVPSSDVWLDSYFPGGIGNGQSGFIGGGQAGYNWQTGAFVLGIVTDFDGSTLSKSFNYSSSPFTGTGIPYVLNGDTLNVNAKASLDWLGTTRGKVGFVVTPDNRLMIYGTGGVAYGGGSSHFSVYDLSTTAYTGAAIRTPRVLAGRSARASNMPSPTTSRSALNTSTPTWATRRSRRARTPTPRRSSRASTRPPRSTTTRRSSALS